MSKLEPHVEVIRLLTTAINNNEKEIERIKSFPESKKVVKALESLNKKYQKGIDKLRKEKRIPEQQKIF